jgi:hypothetical protein
MNKHFTGICAWTMLCNLLPSLLPLFCSCKRRHRLERKKGARCVAVLASRVCISPPRPPPPAPTQLGVFCLPSHLTLHLRYPYSLSGNQQHVNLYALHSTKIDDRRHMRGSTTRVNKNGQEVFRGCCVSFFSAISLIFLLLISCTSRQ